jgi:hypothetical protein
MATFYLAGFMYINGCGTENRRVLIPDSDSAEIGDPPIHAAIYVDKDQCVSETWGAAKLEHDVTVDGQNVTVFEFPLKKRSLVSLPDAGTDKACNNLKDGLPSAQKADPNFVPNLTTPDTVAEVTFGGGTLESFRLGGKEIVRCGRDLDLPPRGPSSSSSSVGGDKDDDLDADSTVTVTIVDSKSREPTGEKFSLTVKGGAHVIIGHTRDLFQVGPVVPRPASAVTALYEKVTAAGDPSTFASWHFAEVPPDQLAPVADKVLKYLKKNPHFTDGDGPPWCC